MAERDPFDLLPDFVDPEPDPVIMNATIAQSREAFLRRSAAPRRAFWTRLRHSGAWLLPAGAGAVALVAAILVAPSLVPQTSIPSTAPTVADGPAVVAPTPQPPAIATGPEQAAPGGGTRMGMQPPTAAGGSASMLGRKRSTTFDGSNLRVEVRESGSVLEFYLPEIAPAAPIDSQVLLSGEEARVVGAFQIADREIVAIQLDLDGTLVWRAYRPVDGAYARDQALSDRVADAPDEAAVRARLATP